MDTPVSQSKTTNSSVTASAAVISSRAWGQEWAGRRLANDEVWREIVTFEDHRRRIVDMVGDDRAEAGRQFRRDRQRMLNDLFR